MGLWHDVHLVPAARSWAAGDAGLPIAAGWADRSSIQEAPEQGVRAEFPPAPHTDRQGIDDADLKPH